MKYFLAIIFALCLAMMSCRRKAEGPMLLSKPEGAGLWAGEELLGNTPMPLPPGGEYIMRYPGCQEYIVKIAQEPEKRQRSINVVLAPLPEASCTIFCATTPTGADVFLDGENKGQTPLELKGLPPQNCELTFKKADRDTVTVAVEWQAEETVRSVDVKLPSTMVVFYRTKLQNEPNDILHYADLGHHLVQDGELQEAMSVFKAGLELILSKKASANASRLWDEVRRVVSVQYAYGDTATVKQARQLALDLIRELYEEYPNSNVLSLYTVYIDTADAMKRRNEAQRIFSQAYKKWPKEKKMEEYLKKGFVP